MPVNGYWQFSEVVAELEISGSTLSQWSEEFVSFLSIPDDNVSPPGEGDSRLYTDEDLVVLATIKDLLAEGFTSAQVAEYLKKARQSEREIEREPEKVEEELYPLVAQESSGVALGPAAKAITRMLQTLSESQQAILNSQQANRDLLGVVIQDNFNLKEENARLRDRMLHLEQELAELKRKETERRETMEVRLRELERELESARTSRSQEEKKGCLAALFGIF
ncbi:MAG: MerR family transcriptional regulator [Anaerolineae bacterium]